MEPLKLKYHPSIQNLKNGNAIQTFAPRSLIFKLQDEVLKFNDIRVSLSSPKPDLELNL